MTLAQEALDTARAMNRCLCESVVPAPALLQLEAEVVGSRSGKCFTDGLGRIVLRFKGCDAPWNELVMPVREGVSEDDRFVGLMSKVEMPGEAQ